MKIAVLGGGTWAIALAKLLYENGNAVTVWSALPEEIKALSTTHAQKNLPGVTLPDGIRYTTDLTEAVAQTGCVVFATASAYVRVTAELAAPLIPEDALLVDVAKGLEPGTQRTMTQVITDAFSSHHRTTENRLIALSGPTHAEEVAQNIPTSIVSACENEETAKAAAELFRSSYMRVYTNTDVLGVELCGALKNIIALAAGMIRGMGMGDNTNAMLITRGIAEITRMGLAMGCRRRTFSGLAGIGDLIVTCTSVHSRNFRCGELIGKGMPYTEASRRIGMVVEGYHALEAAMELSRQYDVELPIVSAVYAVVKCGRDPGETMQDLMAREIKSELES